MNHFTYFSPLEQFDAVSLISFYLFGKYDFSFTNILLPLLLVIIFMYLLVKFFLNKLKLVPVSWQLGLESLYTFIIDIILQQVGILGVSFFSFIFTIFCFVLGCNLISLFPYGVALTSHIIMIFFLSLGLGVSLSLFGLVKHGTKFFKFFIPSCPFLLLFLLILLEIFSYVLRFFSLAIRLCANIMAGHTLVHIITTFILNVSLMESVISKILIIFIVSFLLLAILSLEFGVACLQAYVFIILTTIYFSDVINEPGH